MFRLSDPPRFRRVTSDGFLGDFQASPARPGSGAEWFLGADLAAPAKL